MPILIAAIESIILICNYELQVLRTYRVIWSHFRLLHATAIARKNPFENLHVDILAFTNTTRRCQSIISVFTDQGGNDCDFSPKHREQLKQTRSRNLPTMFYSRHRPTSIVNTTVLKSGPSK